MLNKVILIGNLGADPETRTSQGGMAIANLRIATSERKKEKDQWVDHTEWHRVVCFGRTAENVAKYCKKGKQIYIEGALRTTKYTDKSGVEKWSTEIVANDVKFLGGGGGGGGGGRDGGGGGGGGRDGGGGGRDGGRDGGGGGRDGGDGGFEPSYGGGGGGGGASGGDDDIPF